MKRAQLSHITLIELSQWQHLSNQSAYYLGKSYALFEQHERQGLMSVGDLVNQIFVDIRDEIVNIDAQLGTHPQVLWLASDMCEGNLYLTDFPLNIAKAVVMVRLATENPTAMFVFDEASDVHLFHRILLANGFRVRGVAKQPLKNRIKKIMVSWALRFLHGWQHIQKIRALTDVRRLHHHPQNLDLGADKIVFSWAAFQAFEDNRLFTNDRYFGSWLGQLAKEYTVKIIAKPVLSQESPEEYDAHALKCSPNMLFFEDFIGAWDVVKAHLWGLCFISFLFKKLKIQNINLTPLYRAFVLQEVRSSRIPYALLHRFALKKMARFFKTGATFIYPFENQPWEKVLLHTFQTNTFLKQKNIQTLAYQFSALSENYLGSYFSKAQVKAKVTPTEMIVSDTDAQRLFSGQRCSRIVPLENVRYRASLKAPFPLKKCGEQKVLLCCASISAPLSEELFIKAIQVTQKANMRLKMNFHPLLSPNAVEQLKALCLSFEHVHIETQSVTTLLENVDAIFYNSSTVCFDASLNHIPAIFVASDTDLNLNRFDAESSLVFRTVDEGVALVQRLFETEASYEKMALLQFQAARAFVTPAF